MHADSVKIIGGDYAAGRPISTIADAECGSGNLFCNPGINQGSAPLEIEKVGPGNGVAIVATTDDSGNRCQLLLIDNQRVRAEQNTLDPAQNRSVGSDPQGQ